jgi:hypothetical protein
LQKDFVIIQLKTSDSAESNTKDDMNIFAFLQQAKKGLAQLIFGFESFFPQLGILLSFPGLGSEPGIF